MGGALWRRSGAIVRIRTACPRVIFAADLSQDHLPGGTVQQTHAERTLQCLHLVAYRRRRQAQAARRRGEPAALGDRTNAVMLARRSMRFSDYPMWPDTSSDKWLLIRNFPRLILSGGTERIPFELMGAEDGRDHKRGIPRKRGHGVGSARCRGRLVCLRAGRVNCTCRFQRFPCAACLRIGHNCFDATHARQRGNALRSEKMT
jgi:hypothetical protein